VVVDFFSAVANRSDYSIKTIARPENKVFFDSFSSQFASQMGDFLEREWQRSSAFSAYMSLLLFLYEARSLLPNAGFTNRLSVLVAAHEGFQAVRNSSGVWAELHRARMSDFQVPTSLGFGNLHVRLAEEIATQRCASPLRAQNEGNLRAARSWEEYVAEARSVCNWQASPVSVVEQLVPEEFHSQFRDACVRVRNRRACEEMVAAFYLAASGQTYRADHVDVRAVLEETARSDSRVFFEVWRQNASFVATLTESLWRTSCSLAGHMTAADLIREVPALGIPAVASPLALLLVAREGFDSRSTRSGLWDELFVAIRHDLPAVVASTFAEFDVLLAGEIAKKTCADRNLPEPGAQNAAALRSAPSWEAFLAEARSVCAEPQEEEETVVCDICLRNGTEVDLGHTCGGRHFHCQECFSGWMNRGHRNCPMCRGPVAPADLEMIRREPA
jgi:hypothetical protein